MHLFIEVIYLPLIPIFLHYLMNRNGNIYIYIGNSFKNYYHLPTKLECKNGGINYKCIFSHNNETKYHATIYNGNRLFPSKPNGYFNIIITTEKLSQVLFMKSIGEGKNKYYQLAVDYRLFTNKNHISRNIYTYYNLSRYIEQAKRNYGNISSFLKRKDIVYIQKVGYKNRQFIVKEMMKYVTVDSYGFDLNNKKWPKNLSKIDILKQYKFCIAIENSVILWGKNTKLEAQSINNDYVTEKLLDCFLAGTIPIYFGPKNINCFLPHPDSIINFSNYISIKDLTDYIKYIHNNKHKLEKHLRWYNGNISSDWFNRFNNLYTFNYCMICNRVKEYYFPYNHL